MAMTNSASRPSDRDRRVIAFAIAVQMVFVLLTNSLPLAARPPLHGLGTLSFFVALWPVARQQTTCWYPGVSVDGRMHLGRYLMVAGGTAILIMCLAGAIYFGS